LVENFIEVRVCVNGATEFIYTAQKSSTFNLWLDRKQIDELKRNLPKLEIPDYQWDLYEKDSIGRVVPKPTVHLN